MALRCDACIDCLFPFFLQVPLLLDYLKHDSFLNNLSPVILQLPALICPGITLVVSPLVSLIQDQIMHLLQVLSLFRSIYYYLFILFL